MTQVGSRTFEPGGLLALVLLAIGLCWVCACTATTDKVKQGRFDRAPAPDAGEPVASNPRVRISFDPRATIPQSGSFSFRQAQAFPNDPRVDIEALGTRVRQAILNTMRTKGYRYKELSPDLVVGLRTTLSAAGETPGDPDPAEGSSWRGALNDVSAFEEGSLVLDILEWRSNRLLWRGVYEARLLVDVSEAEKERRINEAVRRLLEHFPPKSADSNP